MVATSRGSNYFDAHEEGGALVVSFIPQQLTDEDNIEQLGQELFSLVDKDQYRRIILDLSRLDYVTSAALGKFITLHRKLRRQDGALVLCRLQPHMQDILRASRLLDYFQTADSIDEARIALGA